MPFFIKLLKCTWTGKLPVVNQSTSREQTFHPMLKWAQVPAFFAPGTRETFSPGWCLQPGLKVPAQRLLRSAQWQGSHQPGLKVLQPLVPVGNTNPD